MNAPHIKLGDYLDNHFTEMFRGQVAKDEKTGELFTVDNAEICERDDVVTLALYSAPRGATGDWPKDLKFACMYLDDWLD